MSSDVRPSVSEMVVVEGIHDKQRVDEAVDADVLVLGGDRIAHRIMDVLRRAVQVRGVIILTDPDGAGERIRRRIDQSVPGCKHAYLPRQKAIADGGLGVEHARAEDVRAALLQAKSPAQERVRQITFTQADMLAAGLLSSPDAAERRSTLGDILGIGFGNAKAFLNKLNALGVTRDEFWSAVERLKQDDK